MAKYAVKVGSLKDLGEEYDETQLYYINKRGIIYKSPRAVGGTIPGKPRKSKTSKSRFEQYYDDSQELEGTKKRKTTRKKTATKTRKTTKRK